MKKLKPEAKKPTRVEKSRERMYLDSLDLREWWEDFATEMNKKRNSEVSHGLEFRQGQSKARMAATLSILAHRAQRLPKENHRMQTFVSTNGKKNSEGGFWFSSENIEGLRSEIKRKATKLRQNPNSRRDSCPECDPAESRELAKASVQGIRMLVCS